MMVAEDELLTRFVLRDAGDCRVDFHAVVFDAEGGGIQQLQDDTAWRYPPSGFTGRGRIARESVACLTAEVQLLCHLGYEPDDRDKSDMQLLADRFGLTLPGPSGDDRRGGKTARRKGDEATLPRSYGGDLGPVCNGK